VKASSSRAAERGFPIARSTLASFPAAGIIQAMTVGSKVVCVDDKFPLGIEKFYTALPKAGVVYVIREMSVGINLQGEEGEVCVLLVGLNNPRSSKPPFPERGFKAERFRPLDELKEENARRESVGAGEVVEV
jgi:hypothetical protein